MALKIYKPGQGRYARLGLGALLALALLAGMRSLGNILTGEMPLSVTGGRHVEYATVVPVIGFLVLMAVLLWVMNLPRVANFLIETEVEMGRVVWPSRKTVIGSSVVVIVTVLLLAVVLFGVDTGLTYVLRFIGLYPKVGA